MKRINEIYRIRRRLKACRHAVTADIAAASRLKNAAYAEVMSYAEIRYVPSAVWRKFDAASENLRLAMTTISPSASRRGAPRPRPT